MMGANGAVLFSLLIYAALLYGAVRLIKYFIRYGIDYYFQKLEQQSHGVPQGCRRTFRRNPKRLRKLRNYLRFLHKKDSLSAVFCFLFTENAAMFIFHSPFRIYRFSHVRRCWYG